MIEIYTDGACSSSGKFKGFGGWAYIIKSEKAQFEDAGFMYDTTNNRMEIKAVIKALNQIKETQHIYNENSIIIYTDSQLIVKTIQGKYQKKKNKDMWKELDKIIKDLQDFFIEFKWVKGHHENKMNKYVDKLARKARDDAKKSAEKFMDMIY